MPAKIAFPFTGNDIRTQCNIHNITAHPGNNQIEAWVADGYYLQLLNFQAPGVSPVRKFVLFHPDLPTKTVCGPMTLLKTRKVSCGFDVLEALYFEKVYVVGPFTQADLTPLLATNVDLDTAVPSNSAIALRKYLETHL